MKRRQFLTSALATGAAALTPPHFGATQDVAAETKGMTMQTGIAPVNGLQMAYTLQGEGEPLVLLHGAFATASMWGPIAEMLAERHQIIAVDLQGHGKTADIDRPIRYESMADDVAALLEYIDLSSADIFGYSMGAGVGLQLALRHPGKVRRQVLAAGSFRHDGMYPEVLEGIAGITPDAFAGTPLETTYQAEAPNPEDWPVLVEKLKDLDMQPFAWPEDEIRAISAPTFLIYGDGDVVSPEHAVALFRLVGGGVPADLTGLPASRLAILPGTTHVTLVMEQPERLVGMIEDFLAQPASA